MYLIVTLVIPALMLTFAVNAIYFIVRLVFLLFNVPIPYAPFGWVSVAVAMLWITIILYGYMFGRFRSETTKIEYSNVRIPKGFDGYRIVHISDLHLDGWKGHEKQLAKQVERINALNPDLICFTGDLISMSPDDAKPFISLLREMKAKDGIISVLGNHDYCPYSHESEEAKAKHLAELVSIERNYLGWKLLMNENYILQRQGDSLAILGCENQSVGAHSVVVRGDLAKTAAGTDGMMRILLTHDPSQWRKEVVGATDIPMTLSGHTHAMQMRFFGWTPSVLLYPECDGLYSEGEQTLYVNIGLGGTLPFRLNAAPEITLIELSRQD